MPQTTGRTRLVVTAAAAVALATAAVVAWAASGEGLVDRHFAAYAEGTLTKSNHNWSDVSGLISEDLCDPVGVLTATVTAKVTGAPVEMRLQMVPSVGSPYTLQPGTVRFDPGGTRAFSFTGVDLTPPGPGPTVHTQWRSATGGTVKLTGGTLHVLYHATC